MQKFSKLINYLGAFESDEAVDRFIIQFGWGAEYRNRWYHEPEQGLVYLNTTLNEMRMWIVDQWQAVGKQGVVVVMSNSFPIIKTMSPTEPRVDFLDPGTTIPSGWQIEIYKYSMHRPGPHPAGGIPDRIGKRYRPDRLLSVGQLSWTIPPSLQRVAIRNHFKFAYRWPAPPGTPAPAPGVRGPLGPLTVSTARGSERSRDGTYAVLDVRM